MIRLVLSVWFFAAVALLAGCSDPVTTVDDTPFRAAIARYLQLNNMALVLKEIKQGPVVTENSARLQTSLTHAQLGGPSVTWTIYFARQPDGSWQVTRHES